MTEAADNPYLRDAVMTATPEQLQLMLYDGAIRYSLQARDALKQENFERSYDRLTRAQKIISEMQAGLNYEINRDLCERVASVYGFISRKLVDGNIHRDISAVEDALKVLRIERETWQILVDKVNKVRECRMKKDKVTPSPSTENTLSGDANISEDEQAPAGFSAEG